MSHRDSHKLTETFTKIIQEIICINGTLMLNNEQRVKPFSLTAAQYQIISALGHHQMPLSVPQIAKHMGMSRQGVQKRLNILINKKMIESQHNPHHERSPLYQLTAQGSESYQAINAVHKQCIADIANQLDHEQLSTTLQVLQQFHRYVQQEHPF